MSDVILVEKRAGGVAIVTLNRPEAMNALSRAVRKGLREAIDALQADDSVRAIVLTGAGEKAFTAGLDLKELGADAGALGAANATDPGDNPVAAIESSCKPVIAAINGVAITGGFELALACDVLIASSKARFADTHARVGIMPGWGLSQKLSRLIGIHRAKELSLTGNFLDAETAAAWGLVNRVVAPEALMEAAVKLAEDMAGLEPAHARAYKALIDEGFKLAFGDAIAHEHATSSRLNAAVTPDDVERRRGAVQARGKTQVS
jgi:enoyl-CoA hydratase